MNQEDTQALYEQTVSLLKTQDWYHEMSDDYRAFTDGSNNMRSIIANLRKMPMHIAIELWESYAPANKFGAKPTWMSAEEVEA